ncbi:MAG: hydratase [Hyphomicrobiales bacterium]|nr:MAG: hydratase [Hyphomicrobiales bacterium]
MQPSSDRLAERLVAAHARHEPVAWKDLPVLGFEDAYRVQRSVIDALAPVGGWKIGLKADTGFSAHAALPSFLIVPSGTNLRGPAWRLRGIEAEVAVRLGRDLTPADASAEAATLQTAIDAMLPVIEVVETRLADWETAPAPLKLADLQSFGALVIGAPRPPIPDFDPREVAARVSFDGRIVVETTGGNPAGHIATLLRLLAQQTAGCARRPQAGDIVTTGSCTGMSFAAAGSRVQASLMGLGEVDVRFD